MENDFSPQYLCRKLHPQFDNHSLGVIQINGRHIHTTSTRHSTQLALDTPHN